MLEEVQNRRLLVDSDSDEEAAKPSTKPRAKTKPTDILQEVSGEAEPPPPAQSCRPCCLLHVSSSKRAVQGGGRAQLGISGCLLTKGTLPAGSELPPSSLGMWLPFPLSPKSSGSPVPRAHLSHDSRTPRGGRSETTTGVSLCFASLLSMSGQKGFFSAQLAGEGLSPQPGPLCCSGVDPCPRGPPPVGENQSSEPAGVNPSRVPWPGTNPRALGIGFSARTTCRQQRPAGGAHAAPQLASGCSSSGWGCARPG